MAHDCSYSAQLRRIRKSNIYKTSTEKNCSFKKSDPSIKQKLINKPKFNILLAHIFQLTRKFHFGHDIKCLGAISHYSKIVLMSLLVSKVMLLYRS